MLMPSVKRRLLLLLHPVQLMLTAWADETVRNLEQQASIVVLGKREMWCANRAEIVC